jgi:hypothetical protein
MTIIDTYGPGIQIPVSKFPASVQGFGLPVRAAIIDLDARLQLIEPFTDPWPDWTFVMTAATTNPTYTVNYAKAIKIGNLVIANFFVTFLTAGSGAYSMAIPYASAGSTGQILGHSTWSLGGANNRLGRTLWQNGASSAAPAAEDGTRVTQAVPIVIVNGAQVNGMLQYWAA